MCVRGCVYARVYVCVCASVSACVCLRECMYVCVRVCVLIFRCYQVVKDFEIMLVIEKSVGFRQLSVDDSKALVSLFAR